MPGYETRKLDVQVGAFKGRLRALRDHNQYAPAPDGVERPGISPANWILFGQLWPASQVLAKAVKSLDTDGRRILELGCGLGLPSLVLQWRGADITASDHHPLSEEFLDYNAALNHIPKIPYVDLPWSSESVEKRPFDVILGSDILYERGQAALLADLIRRLAAPRAKVIIACPGRGYRNKFSRAMKSQGFQLKEKRLAFNEGEAPPHKGRLLKYRRATQVPDRRKQPLLEAI